MVGVGGLFIFEVKAGNAKGDGHFSISYGRSWEAANMAVGQFDIPINVLA